MPVNPPLLPAPPPGVGDSELPCFGSFPRKGSGMHRSWVSITVRVTRGHADVCRVYGSLPFHTATRERCHQWQGWHKKHLLIRKLTQRLSVCFRSHTLPVSAPPSTGKPHARVGAVEPSRTVCCVSVALACPASASSPRSGDEDGAGSAGTPAWGRSGRTRVVSVPRGNRLCVVSVELDQGAACGITINSSLREECKEHSFLPTAQLTEGRREAEAAPASTLSRRATYGAPEPTGPGQPAASPPAQRSAWPCPKGFYKHRYPWSGSWRPPAGVGWPAAALRPARCRRQVDGPLVR